MSTLANPKMVETLLVRLTRLTPDAPRQWGRMTAPQMIAHLNDSFAAVAGERHASLAITAFSRTLMKWVALRTPMPWPHGVATRPEIAQDQGGTPPGDWTSDVARLRLWIESFPQRDGYGKHPIFGSMNRRDWLVWAYRHVDHHFRQFGA